MWYADEKRCMRTAKIAQTMQARTTELVARNQKRKKHQIEEIIVCQIGKTKWNNLPSARVEVARKDGGIRHLKSLSIRLWFVDEFVGRVV
jgi:hypothetical protein